jgi:hypothetical protein
MEFLAATRHVALTLCGDLSTDISCSRRGFASRPALANHR